MLLTAPTMPFEQSPAAARDNADAMESLSNALDQLDERQRLAIHLFYLDPDPVAAARESLGLSRSGYYKLLARARDQLALHMRKVHTP